MKKYYPILLSKAGEFGALRHLEQIVKDEITPVIEVLERIAQTEAFLLNNWTFEDNEVIVDFSLLEDLGANIADINRGLIALLNAGVNVIPTVQQNSPVAYVRMVASLASIAGCDVCIRTSNDSGGFVNYSAQVNTMLKTLGITEDRAVLLLDLGTAELHNYNMLSTIATLSIEAVLAQSGGWKEIVVASGSFPPNLSHLVPPNRVYPLQRYEWDAWTTINILYGDTVKYGDYGTKNPVFEDAAFLGSCSIKYTADTHFIIYRGERSDNHADGFGQFITFSTRLVASTYFSGPGFSWGDAQIEMYSNETIADPNRRTGNLQSWVTISQNHHITLLHSLL